MSALSNNQRKEVVTMMPEEAAEKLKFCHSEGELCPRNLLSSWDLRKSRSLAALGMTTKATFSAVFETAPTGKESLRVRKLGNGEIPSEDYTGTTWDSH
jgi:hypothetical protein